MTRGKEGNIPLECLGQTGERGEEGEGKERREKERGREEEKRREKLLILSSIPRDLTVGVRRSKRQSRPRGKSFE